MDADAIDRAAARRVGLRRMAASPELAHAAVRDLLAALDAGAAAVESCGITQQPHGQVQVVLILRPPARPARSATDVLR